MLQRDVRVRRRHREGARGGAGIAVFPHQRERRRAIGGDAGRERDAHERAGRQPHALAQRCHRIEDGAGRSRQRAALDGDRVGRRSPATQESRTIGFPLDRTAKPPVHGKDMERPGVGLLGGSRTPAEQQTRALRVVLRFDEEFAESGMGDIVFGACEHDFGVAGDLDFARPVAAIGDRQPPDFHIVFRRHDDLEQGFEVAVAAPEGALLEIERGFEHVRFTADRLIGGRPDVA